MVTKLYAAVPGGSLPPGTVGPRTERKGERTHAVPRATFFYTIRRLVAVVVLLFIISITTFAVFFASPVDPASLTLSLIHI